MGNKKAEVEKKKKNEKNGKGKKNKKTPWIRKKTPREREKKLIKVHPLLFDFTPAFLRLKRENAENSNFCILFLVIMRVFTCFFLFLSPFHFNVKIITTSINI